MCISLCVCVCVCVLCACVRVRAHACVCMRAIYKLFSRLRWVSVLAYYVRFMLCLRLFVSLCMHATGLSVTHMCVKQVPDAKFKHKLIALTLLII
jgi:hypothetical protein